MRNIKNAGTSNGDGTRSSPSSPMTEGAIKTTN